MYSATNRAKGRGDWKWQVQSTGKVLIADGVSVREKNRAASPHPVRTSGSAWSNAMIPFDEARAAMSRGESSSDAEPFLPLA